MMKTRILRIRIDEEMHEQMQQRMRSLGLFSKSEFIRFCVKKFLQSY